MNKSSDLSNTLSLTKIVLGTTLVLYPAMFKEYGIFPMILSLTLIGGVLCSTSLYFLYISSQVAKAKTYEELGERVLGRGTRVIIKTSVFLIGLFSLIVYIKMAAELLDNILKCGELYSKIYSACICGGLSTFSPRISKLKIVNLIGLATIFILISTVFGQFLGNFKKLKMDDLNFTSYKPGIFNNFGLISLCFCSHFVIIPFMNSLKDSVNIIYYSSTLSVVVYIFVGLFGYLSFPSTTPNWAQNSFSSSTLNQFLSVLLILVIVLSYPLCVIASKDILNETFNLPSGVMDIMTIWLLTLVSCGCVLRMTGYELMNTLFLSFGSLVMFIYPTLFYFILLKPTGTLQRILGLMTFTVGLSMMYQSFKEIYYYV